jgi:hypothetical protein
MASVRSRLDSAVFQLLSFRAFEADGFSLTSEAIQAVELIPRWIVQPERDMGRDFPDLKPREKSALP